MPSGDPQFDRKAVTEILRPGLERLGLAEASTAEGLRDRKKRALRQLISDTATFMFLDRGFDAVTVKEVAEACDVSEKTVFNYFPTKESLLLDREEYEAALIGHALRDRGDDVSLVDSIVEVLEADVAHASDHWATTEDPQRAMTLVQRFAGMIRETPSLQAAAQAMAERLREVAAEALAARASVSPDDPEPQVAAMIVMGLWSVRFQALQHHATPDRTPEEVRAAVVDDIRRAARVADAGLSSFNLVVHPKSGRDQLREAAAVTNEARKQVVAAVKRARDAWKHVLQEAKAQHEAYHESGEAGPHGHRHADREAHRQAREARMQARQVQRQAQREVWEAMKEMQRETQATMKEHQRKLKERQQEAKRLQDEAKRQAAERRRR